MTEDGHRQAVEELRAQRLLLDRSAGIRAYTELSWGMAQHLIAAGGQRRLAPGVQTPEVNDQIGFRPRQNGRKQLFI